MHKTLQRNAPGSNKIPCNITRQQCHTFCSGCPCNSIKEEAKQYVVKHIRSSRAMERVQVDLIKIKWRNARASDQQPEECILLVAQDHFTQFISFHRISVCDIVPVYGPHARGEEGVYEASREHRVCFLDEAEQAALMKDMEQCITLQGCADLCGCGPSTGRRRRRSFVSSS